MKMITAIIRPWKLDDLQMAVARLGVQGITVTEVTGYGRQRGHSEHYKGSEYQVEFVPKLRVEIVLDDTSAEAVVEAISNVCRTGKTGDGKIFLAPVGEAVRIRTRESGAAAAPASGCGAVLRLWVTPRKALLTGCEANAPFCRAAKTHAPISGAPCGGPRLFAPQRPRPLGAEAGMEPAICSGTKAPDHVGPHNS